jgi:hypothetical protein
MQEQSKILKNVFIEGDASFLMTVNSSKLQSILAPVHNFL